MNLQIVEIPAKGELKPEHHMYESIMYVMKVKAPAPSGKKETQENR